MTFNSQGGSAVAAQSVARNGTATRPANPTREGYTFAGWYTDAAGTTAYDFATPVTATTTLYAKWTEGAPDDTPSEPSGPLAGFSDAGQISSWAVAFVTRLVEAEIISGRSNDTIDPKGNVTRAEFSKMIVLGLKIEAGETPKSFTDVTAGDWFKEVVDIASSRGIVLGVSETAFAPNRTISRQDLCTIVYRALTALDVTLPELSDSGAFPDEAQIADYALDAVKTLKQLNIIAGRGDGAFDPRAYATREETAKIVCGVIDYIASTAD
ncbi:MAG: S-layer homology domain-containing protein [Oscillospiraceae bacterium]|nr:S-layer homology domain-containing protein [Oscillospiraceae bacterium]